MFNILVPDCVKRGGIVPVIVQDNIQRDVLMLAYTDRDCFLETVRTGEAVYFSTSRKMRWKKGETSGAIQKVRKILIDCDGDALIYLVDPQGPCTCHTGARSCFFRTIGNNKACTWPALALIKRLENVSIESVKVGYHHVGQSTI